MNTDVRKKKMIKNTMNNTISNVGFEFVSLLSTTASRIDSRFGRDEILDDVEAVSVGVECNECPVFIVPGREDSFIDRDSEKEDLDRSGFVCIDGVITICDS